MAVIGCGGVGLAVIYWAIRDFGPATQAGFGIAQRVMQALFVPVLAVAFAAAPVAGQNFGAGQADRVKETFRAAAWIGDGRARTPTPRQLL